MKIIKLKENSINPISWNYLADYLVSLGISSNNIDSFILGPKDEDKDNPLDLDNMEIAISAMHDAILHNKKFFIQVDSDVDGNTSAAIFYNYFKTRYENLDIIWRLQEGKEHGIINSTVPEDREIIIIPDAGSMQLEEQEELSKNGKTVIILDHHTVLEQKQFNNVILVNNQSSAKFNNKFLSGAGIVLMFIEAYDEKYYDGELWSKYMDLAALGIIADMMNTCTLGNNYIIEKGLSCIRNKMFQELLQMQSYSISNIANPSKIDIAFYIAPIINGLIRSGLAEEKEVFFKALIDSNNTEIFTTTSRGITRHENIYQYAARIAKNAKSRQDAVKKRGAEFLNNKIKTKQLDRNKILVVTIDNDELNKVNQNMTGLTAMELCKTYNKPTLVLREHDEKDGTKIYSGSGRSKDFHGMNGFLNFILDSQLDIMAEGHQLAFGTSFTEKGLKDFIEYSNDKLSSVDFNNETVEVDYWFKDTVNSRILRDFAKNIRIYGNGIPQPKFAFTFNLDAKDLFIMGKDKSSMKITLGDISLVMFKAPKVIRDIQTQNNCKITCIGRSQINSFNGLESVQVIIDDIQVDKREDTLFSALDLI